MPAIVPPLDVSYTTQAQSFIESLSRQPDPISDTAQQTYWAWAESIWKAYWETGRLQGGRAVNALFGATKLPKGWWGAVVNLLNRSNRDYQALYLERLVHWHEMSWRERQQALDLSDLVPKRSAQDQQLLLQGLGRYALLSHLEQLGCNPDVDPGQILAALGLRAHNERFAAPVAVRIAQQRGAAYLDAAGSVVLASQWAKPAADYLALCAIHDHTPSMGVEVFVQLVLKTEDVASMLTLSRVPGMDISRVVDRLVTLGEPDALLEFAHLRVDGVVHQVWQGLMGIAPAQCDPARYVKSLHQFLRHHAMALGYPNGATAPDKERLLNLAAVMLGTLTMGDKSLVILRPLVAETLKMLRQSEVGRGIADRFEATRVWPGKPAVGERFMYAIYGTAGQEAARLLIALQMTGKTTPLGMTPLLDIQIAQYAEPTTV